MNRYNQLFQEIFKQPLSHEANVGLLEKTIADYPYFTPAHFFLLHLTEKQSPAFSDQAKKTALLFNNNYWLNFQLLELNMIASKQDHEPKEAAISNETEIAAALDEQFIESDQATEKTGEQEIFAADESRADANATSPAGNSEGHSFSGNVSIETVSAMEAADKDEPVTEAKFQAGVNESSPQENIDEHSFRAALSNETAPAKELADENKIVAAKELHVPPDEGLSVANVEDQPFSGEVLPEDAPSFDATFTQETEEDHLTKDDIAFIPEDPEQVMSTANSSPAADAAVEATILSKNGELVEDKDAATFKAEELPTYTEDEMAENEADYNQTDLPPDGGEDAGMDHVSLKMAGTLAGINLDKNTTEDTISFEPLHASDYFASLGIRLSDELKPADKLGLQLKSFTEWLKTMKKMHAEQLADTSSSDSTQEKNDKNIQELAEASNKQNEILTEAMADVFQQQGKTGKAIELYEKLSLLNPSKKVYFAAKIKQLKD